MNSFLNGLTNATNFTVTENGAWTHKSTRSAVLDLFAMGGAYRNRSDEDVILLFRNAFNEDETLALKCLFYLRDILNGQGERRFFRVCMKDLATWNTAAARRNIHNVPNYGRWDDLYVFTGTPLENDAFAFMKEQLALDIQCKTPSLLAKWLKSENTSSVESRRLANRTREAFGMSHKQYRKTLSTLRERINVLERLMSAGKWDEIEFDKIPSKAGMIYRNAFARHDLEREQSEKEVQTYADFAKDTTKKVNAKVLYPQEIANQAFRNSDKNYQSTNRLMLQKCWDNLPDFYQGKQENGIAVVDVSGSMCGTPMDAAVSLGAYVAEKSTGPFANHFITFSGKPQLVKFEGVDIVDKFKRCRNADWAMNTNIEAVFNLLLNTAIKNNCTQEDLPSRLYIFSDMQFDGCITCGTPSNNWYGSYNYLKNSDEINTLIEQIAKKWAAAGYRIPKLIFWNLDARSENIPAIGEGFSYVSGFSPSMIDTILSGKDGFDLMLAKLNSERYSAIQ